MKTIITSRAHVLGMPQAQPYQARHIPAAHTYFPDCSRQLAKLAPQDSGLIQVELDLSVLH